MHNIFKKNYDAQTRSRRWVFGTMLLFGTIGLIAAFTLTVEKFHLLENPDTVLSCSFNVVLNCSTVMQTWQSSVFGFPNMILGLMAYSIVMTIALLGLLNVTLPRKFLIVVNIGYLLGALFAYWLFFQSVFAIQVLCPWCLIVTFATTLILATMTHYNLQQNTFNLSKKTNSAVQKFLAKDFDKLLIASWVVILIIVVFLKFGSSLFV